MSGISGTHFVDLRDHVERLASDFERAEPFPHVVLDDFLKLTPEELDGVYPGPEWPHWNRREDYYQSGKMYCRDTSVIPAPLVSLLSELSAAPFLGMLEHITGVRGLIPDPYYEGGGLHCSGPGGVLIPHTDFHYYDRLRLYRRLNVLLYLNPEWDESYGGCLELWKKGETRPAKVVVPRWGTCVIFRTDDRSIHGFSTPVQAGHWRRSLALYYYSSQEAAAFSGDGNTYWQQHGLNRPRVRLYQLLASAAHKLSRIAHWVNPNKEPRR